MLLAHGTHFAKGGAQIILVSWRDEWVCVGECVWYGCKYDMGASVWYGCKSLDILVGYY